MQSQCFIGYVIIIKYHFVFLVCGRPVPLTSTPYQHSLLLLWPVLRFAAMAPHGPFEMSDTLNQQLITRPICLLYQVRTNRNPSVILTPNSRMPQAYVNIETNPYWPYIKMGCPYTISVIKICGGLFTRCCGTAEERSFCTIISRSGINT